MIVLKFRGNIAENLQIQNFTYGAVIWLTIVIAVPVDSK